MIILHTIYFTFFLLFSKWVINLFIDLWVCCTFSLLPTSFQSFKMFVFSNLSSLGWSVSYIYVGTKSGSKYSINIDATGNESYHPLFPYLPHCGTRVTMGYVLTKHHLVICCEWLPVSFLHSNLHTEINILLYMFILILKRSYSWSDCALYCTLCMSNKLNAQGVPKAISWVNINISTIALWKRTHNVRDFTILSW